jgi:hypothetical protein
LLTFHSCVLAIFLLLPFFLVGLTGRCSQHLKTPRKVLGF